jgi:hypothetical protein
MKHVEFFGQAWVKSKDKAPNLSRLIEFFNSVGSWTASCILQEPKVRDRAKRMEIMIRLAECFLELRNYYLLVAVISGLNSAAIARLQFTKDKISKRSKQVISPSHTHTIQQQQLTLFPPPFFAFKSLSECEELMSMEGSHKRYRDLMNKAEPPCIPYMYCTPFFFSFMRLTAIFLIAGACTSPI